MELEVILKYHNDSIWKSSRVSALLLLNSLLEFITFNETKFIAIWEAIPDAQQGLASLTVPGGQEFHFPHFFLKFRSIFLIFLKLLLIFLIILALRVGYTTVILMVTILFFFTFNDLPMKQKQS